MQDEPLARRPGFDEEVAGKPAECDGGAVSAGGAASRQEFAGVLTGDYYDHGDPPWRWYLINQLRRKPEGYPWDAVWCESGSLFVSEQRRERPST